MQSSFHQISSFEQNSSKNFRVRFPPNASRTDRFYIFGPTDLASGHSTSTSRCHRQLMGRYIQWLVRLKISSNVMRPLPIAAAPLVSGSSPSSPVRPRRRTTSPSTVISTAVAAVEELHRVRVSFDPFRASLSDSMHDWIACNLATNAIHFPPD